MPIIQEWIMLITVMAAEHRLMQNSTSEQSDIYHQQLSEYCGLDTYSLYKLYIWLKDILNR